MARKISEEKEEKLCLIINKIYMKIYNNDYYIDEENREVRSIIGRRTSKMEIYFRNEMAKIYDIVANKVYEEYERKDGNFNIVDYCYITDLDPICLLKVYKHCVDNKNYSKILLTLFSNYQRSDRLVKYSTDSKSNTMNYLINGFHIDNNDVKEIMNFIDEENLPHYEAVLNALVKEYANNGYLTNRRKNSENNFVLSKKRV